MKTKILATLGAAALAMGVSATASQAQIISQPCETCGVAIGAPLPEGVFFVDLEDYGGKDHTNARLGVNIPVVVWSTPFSFYDTRVEVLYAAPFTHTDGPTNHANAGVLNRLDAYSQALLLLFNHSFGNGFSAGLIVGPRTPDNFTNANRGAAADIRASFSYVGPAAFLGGGFLGNGPIKAVATFAYSGDFGGKKTAGTATPACGGNGVSFGTSACGFNDNIYVDYTLTKTFGKFEIGIVGYAQTDLNQVRGTTFGRSVSVGGLIGYDFGKFTLQGYATREVAASGNPGFYNGYYNIGAFQNKYDTRGYVRLIVPLYVAPAAPVVARY